MLPPVVIRKSHCAPMITAENRYDVERSIAGGKAK